MLMAKDKPGPAIIAGPTSGTNLIKGRDVRFYLEPRGLDPMLIDILAKIAEVNHTNSLAIAELANLLDQQMNIIQKMTDVAANMKEVTEQFKRGMSAEAESDESIN
jgi:hypothetical protein